MKAVWVRSAAVLKKTLIVYKMIKVGVMSVITYNLYYTYKYAVIFTPTLIKCETLLFIKIQ